MTCQQGELIECSKCGVEAARYKPGMRQCAACVRKDARDRAGRRDVAAKRAAVAEWKKLNPGKVVLQRQAAAAAAGRQYRSKEQVREERQLDRWTRAVIARMKRAHRTKRPTAGMSETERYRWQMENKPGYAINGRMRTSINKALKGGKAGRRWELLVGYTIGELMAHLERQLPRGYTMADFGTGRLHIDHIVPKSAFDVTNPAELKACWALSNLRPLPAVVNMRKGAKRVTLL